MHFKSKKISLLILGITSILCSRTMFAFFNDPEGSNLLIVIGMALILYFLSLAVYLYYLSATGPKRLLLAVLVQMLLAAGFWFFLS